MEFRIVLTIVMKHNLSVEQLVQIIEQKDLGPNVKQISFHVMMDSALLSSMYAMGLQTVRMVLTKYLRDADHYRKDNSIYLHVYL